jgi:hypothetical protein
MTDTDEVIRLKKRIEVLESLNAYYENNGASKLFYGLNRKASEMADILNKTNLKDLDLADAKDKTFDRLKVIWNDAASIATAIKALGESSGITNDENSDTNVAIYKRITTPESIADHVGELAGKNNS